MTSDVAMEFGIFYLEFYELRNCEYKAEKQNSSTQVHVVDSNRQHHYDVCRPDQCLHC